MECKICQKQASHVKTQLVRQKYNADYYLCDNCGFLFVGNPSWLDEAYKESINITDTGYVMRNVYLSRKTLVLFTLIFGKKYTYLDFAGGYGILSRLMRDYGLSFLNVDKYTTNLFMKNFEYKDESIKAITCFECFEHLSDPKKEIDEIFSISPNIFFSTVLFDGSSVPREDWEYYGLNHGQHISFYSLKTLNYIANIHNVYLCSNGENLHLFTKKRVSQLLFNFLLKLTTLQFDVVIRKLLNSKTGADSLMLVAQGKI